MRHRFSLLSSTISNNTIRLPYNSLPSRISSYHPHVRNVFSTHNRQKPARPRRVASIIIIIISSAAAGFIFRAFVRKSPTEDCESPSFLDPHSFRSFTLVDKEPVSSTSSIFRIRPTHGVLDAKQLQELWNCGIWSVQVKQPELQIVRAYTPLPPDVDPITGKDVDNSHELRLLIRREESGEVSGYLHRLPLGSQIQVRRANVEYRISTEPTDFLFLAGGTGIAPAMQLAYATLRRPSTRNCIMWANRRREECTGGISLPTSPTGSFAKAWLPSLRDKFKTGEDRESASESNRPSVIVQQLQHYEELTKDDPSRLISVEYFVDDERSFIKPAQIGRFLKSRGMNYKNDPQPLRRVLISGPDGFIEYWAGKKPVEGNIDAQGPLGGILSHLDTTGWRIWKL